MSYGYGVMCPWCCSVNSEENVYCNECGGPISSVLCNQCLTTNPPTASFCGRCGEMLQYPQCECEYIEE